jgi:hypothetical protein
LRFLLVVRVQLTWAPAAATAAATAAAIGAAVLMVIMLQSAPTLIKRFTMTWEVRSGDSLISAVLTRRMCSSPTTQVLTCPLLLAMHWQAASVWPSLRMVRSGSWCPWCILQQPGTAVVAAGRVPAVYSVPGCQHGQLQGVDPLCNKYDAGNATQCHSIIGCGSCHV